ncbi:hypothetical protein BHE74_00005474 [Ensete ventricosum]|nr:hypothetical protein BHE74_00005474 [Ensete ventricosum]
MTFVRGVRLPLSPDPEGFMVDIIVIHLKGDVIQWYNWFEYTQGVLTWRSEKPLRSKNTIPEEDLEHKEENTREDLQPVDCMVHGLASYANPQTMKIEGFFKQKPVTVLIDTKSTNNFMDSKVVARSML